MNISTTVVCVCIQEVPLNNERQPDLQTGVIACCSAIHQSVERNSVRYFEELRRHNYVRTSSVNGLLMACFVLSPSCCPSHSLSLSRLHMGMRSIECIILALQWQAQGAAVSPGKVCVANTHLTAAVLQVTPASYLELLTTFIKLLAEKRKDIGVSRQRLEAGLSKLLTTAAQVEVMQVQHHLHHI